MNYYYRQTPGCGGCLLLFLLLLLVAGGAPMLFRVLGFLLYLGLVLFLALLIAVWGFSYYIKRRIRAYEQSQTEAHNLFVHLLVHILTNIARIDGTVTREESEIIHRFFRDHLRYNQSQLYWIRDLMKEARRSTVDLDTLLLEFRNNFAYEPRLILLELIYQVIFTKTAVPRVELDLARKSGILLEISAYDQQRIESRYLDRRPAAAVREEDYYRILGLEPGAGFDRIKAAYRQLSRQYHPDKVSHLGEEFRQVAEEKMKEINQAYHHLKQKFS